MVYFFIKWYNVESSEEYLCNKQIVCKYRIIIVYAAVSEYALIKEAEYYE